MVQDLKDFIEKVKEDKELQERMGEILQTSTKEEVFDNCNAVAAEMGYSITQDDMQEWADEYKGDLNDEELDKVAGGTFTSTPVCLTGVIVSTVISASFSVKVSIQEHHK